jgi:hypothetical protein
MYSIYTNTMDLMMKKKRVHYRQDQEGELKGVSFQFDVLWSPQPAELNAIGLSFHEFEADGRKDDIRSGEDS